MKMHRALVTAAAVVGLTVALPIAPASAAPGNGEVGTSGCGYHLAPAPVAPDAYYNHCTSDGSHIWITINYHLGDDGYKCVGPGDTRLGSTSIIAYAYYNGNLC
jgi:hypothetical protein